MNVAGNDDHEESIQHVEAVTTTEAAIANTSKSKKRIASKESSAESGSAAAKVKDITMSETTRSEQASSIPDSHPPEQQANGTRTRHHNHQQCIAGSSTGPIASSAAKGSKSYNLDTSTQNQQTQPQANSKTSNDAVSENNSVSDNLPMTHSVEVVMKSVELQSPNTILRNRKAHRSTYSLSSSKQPQKHLPTEDNISNTSNSNNYSELCQHTSCNGTTQMDCAVPGVVSISVQRKPSLSSVRDHVPSAINTKPGSFKLCVEESSPAETSLKRAQLSKAKKKTGSGVGSGNGGESGGTDESNDESNDDFDWEEHKIYEVKDDAETSAKMTMVESDVCCRPLHRRIHPWIARFIKNVLVILILLVPKFILKRIHTNHHETIVLIQGGRPYMAVVIGNHLSYFVIQFLIMGLFKIIHKFGSVKVKITLETHDGLVPHIARSVWLFVLIPFWAVFVHNPTCMRAKSRLDFSASIAEGVDMHCRRWIFWWVYRCLWGIQAMNMLYILKRYTMQILSDRFEQDNSKFVELNFQGHVLDGLQKIKQHRPNRSFGQNGHHYRWAEKSTSWLASTYQVAKSPSMSRPSSSKDQKPPTASIVADTTQQRTTWDLLRKSIQRRKNNATRTEIKSATSPSDSPTDAYKDHELEPQEFVRMSKKRKSKLIDSLRNKPIEVL
ncbi:hypothetical protein BGX27_004508 [Mortierella sp. AM989]|nr:hypothetical protein BGX27_004508 [Mortierella sp. AM989]